MWYNCFCCVSCAWILSEENIHSETYSLLIDRYIQDPVEKDKVFNAIVTMPAVEEKAKWAVQWMSSLATSCLGKKRIWSTSVYHVHPVTMQYVFPEFWGTSHSLFIALVVAVLSPFSVRPQAKTVVLLSALWPLLPFLELQEEFLSAFCRSCFEYILNCTSASSGAFMTPGMSSVESEGHKWFMVVLSSLSNP